MASCTGVKDSRCMSPKGITMLMPILNRGLNKEYLVVMLWASSKLSSGRKISRVYNIGRCNII